jgi:hypothetical protein
MKKALNLLIALSLIGATASFADSKKGKKYYMKSLKSKMGNMNGMKFVSMYTMDEWKELFEEDGIAFIETFSERFPKASKVLSGKRFAKKMEHLRDFAVEYASDSGNVLSCGD